MLTNLTTKVKKGIAILPLEVKQFALKGGLLLLFWCLLYGLLLKPFNLIDPLLTGYTASVTVCFMQFFYAGQQFAVNYSINGALISIGNREVLYIGDACNGLDIYVLYIGFILCVPMSIKKMMSYIMLGIIGIFILNTTRCMALIYLFYHKSAYSNIAHHYIFQLIVYSAIFFIWERYFRSLRMKHEISQV